MQFTVKARGDFQRQLEARISKWASVKGIAARIHAPEALNFWLWQEKGVPGHTIVPVDAKVLVFPGEGGTEMRDSVDWPGIRPHHTVANSLEEIRDNASQLLQQALSEGGADDPATVQAAVLEAVHDAKAIIVGAMTGDLPGTRPDNAQFPKQSGKLHGRTAASVFDELAEVVESDAE